MSWPGPAVLASALASIVATGYALRGDWGRATLLQCATLVAIASLHQVCLQLGATAWSAESPLMMGGLAPAGHDLWLSRASAGLLGLPAVSLVGVAALGSARRWREWTLDRRLLGVLGAALTPLLWSEPLCTDLSVSAWVRAGLYAITGGLLVGLRGALPLGGVAWLAAFVAVERTLLMEQSLPRLHCFGGGTLVDPALTCAGFALVRHEVWWSTLALGLGVLCGAAATWQPRDVGTRLALIVLFLVLSLPAWTGLLMLAPCVLRG